MAAGVNDIMPHSRRFIFHANAAALGGRIIREGDGDNAVLVPDGFIDFPGSSLTVVGGKSAVRLSPEIAHPVVRKFVRFQAAEAIAVGDYDDLKKYFAASLKRADRGMLKTTTKVRAEVLGLDVGVDGEPRMHVNGVRGGLTAKSAGDGGETPVRLDPDTGFDGNAVTFYDKGGRAYTLVVEVELRPFNANPTRSALMGAAKTPAFLTRFAASLFLAAPKAAAKSKGKKPGPIGRLKWRRTDSGGLLGSIVKPIRWEGEPFPGSTLDPQHPNRVQIPDLGTLSFGEILVEGQSRRVTMIRGDLGSYIGGELAVCDYQDNGGFS
jgi:hypothetical protein